MTTDTACQRKQRRHDVTGSGNAWVELACPETGGRPHRLPLEDVSISGLSFTFEAELSGIENGASLTDVVVHLGGCNVRGEIVVMHVTPHSETRSLCGALFYAGSDGDLLKWKSAIAGMSVVR
jgi:hypothetical protein